MTFRVSGGRRLWKVARLILRMAIVEISGGIFAVQILSDEPPKIGMKKNLTTSMHSRREGSEFDRLEARWKRAIKTGPYITS
jgi:hypothetical protein